jgi:hypothetical protein
MGSTGWKVEEGPIKTDLYTLLSTKPIGVVGPVHPRAMLAMLRTEVANLHYGLFADDLAVLFAEHDSEAARAKVEESGHK